MDRPLDNLPNDAPPPRPDVSYWPLHLDDPNSPIVRWYHVDTWPALPDPETALD